ncbi:LVIVD repeat-containing protein [Nocardioides taihuensis]|uniref:LVIVD repeat-containing protein n=1 Tax=Nocardioides taihuensis TaxID=1835606 RepID=A0ABW0BD77_9ACTN
MKGHLDTGALNADVWAHDKYAYVGVWSATCPATGVKVVDYHNLSHPRLVSRLQNDEGTSAEDVVVRRVSTPEFTGDLAVTGIQVCGDVEDPVFRGLQFFDVTDPRHPAELGRWTAPEFSVGCHEVDLVQRPDGMVLAGCSNLFAEQINGTGEVVLVDATDPNEPGTAGDWAIGADLGVDPGATDQNLGCFPASFDHSVRFVDQGLSVYGSYWDFGAVLLDITEPSAPSFVSTADIAPPDEDGDVHSVVRAGDTLLVNPEDFSPVDCPDEDFGAWGEVHLFDVSDPAAPALEGTFSTPNSRTLRQDGFYSVHNTEVAKGSQAFSSWYSDGIVWWDYRHPSDPVMRGQFVPPAAEDETGTFPTVAIVWGVFLDRQRNLVLASDMNSGLWILRPRALGNF